MTRRPARLAVSRRAAVLLVAALTVATLGGCKTLSADDRAAKELQAARERGEALQRDNAELQRMIVNQQKQVQALMGLGPQRLEKLFHVTRIELGRHTGGIDLDGADGHEGIKVYLRPIDAHGSVIKAAGDVTIQVYDLAADPKDNLVGEYRFDVDTLAKQWSSGFVSYYFSFECPWKPGRAPKNETLTVRVSFRDYLTGKSFAAQKVCEVKLAPPATTRPAR